MVALNHVCGRDELTDFRRVLEERRELYPVVPPLSNNERILAAPSFLEAIEFD